MKQPSVIKTGLSLAATAAALTTSAVVIPATVSAAPPAVDVSTKLAGKTVFLDPGHQGPKTTLDLNRQVPDGRGGTKPCQTTGMTSLHGVPEHTINWNVAQLVRQSLGALGARVVLSRQDDSGSSDCVDARAAAANRSGADVAISIHADGAPAQDRGFHMIIPRLPVPDGRASQVQGGAGLAATKAVRDAYVKAGFPEANYAGTVDGLQTRSDIAGPALTEVPDVFIEMGNGANPEDASQLETPDGQLRHAIAITTGLVSYLLRIAPAQPGALVPHRAPAVHTGRDAGPQPVDNPGQAAPGASTGAPAQSAPDSPAAPSGGTGQPSTPGQSAPSAYTPGQTAPGTSAPGQGTPGASTPGQTAPGAYAPGQATPGASPQGQTVPGASSQGQAVPGASSQGQTVPGASSQGQAAPGASSPGQTVPGQTVPGANPPGQAAPGGYAPGQTSPGSYSPGQTVPGGSTPGATSPGYGTQPGTQTAPSQPGGTQSTNSAANTLINIAMQLLQPLAQSLGLGDQSGLISGLANLAYSLVSTLLASGTK